MTSQQDKSRLDQIQKAALQEVDSDILRAHNDLFNPVVAPAAQLPEHLFKEKFLPFFAGKVKDDANLNIRTYWVGIAGSAALPVDIVNAKGEVLFQVPPLMNTDFLSQGDNGRGQTFSQIINHSREQANRIPQLGEGVLAELGGNKIASMKAGARPEAAQQWQKIFDHYGVSGPGGKGAVAGGKKSSLDDELDFD